MDKQDSPSEEIVIVGSRYGALADVVTPLFEKGVPIEAENIKSVLGGDEVILSPVKNDYDPHAVGVYTISQRLLGYVWMYQSHAMRLWMKKNQKTYIMAHITSVLSNVGVLTATAETPLQLEIVDRNEAPDWGWAADIPEVLTCITEQSLSLAIDLLHDELKVAEEWSPRLQMRIDNLLRFLPMDLSAIRYKESIELYSLMKQSPIEEVRRQSEFVLHSFVKRGSAHQMQWWVESWLPDFFRNAAESDLLGLFKADHYTLERVEAMLDGAPYHLYHQFKVNRFRFAWQLYYDALPQELYNRLLSLLAVRELMLAQGEGREVDGNKLTATRLAKAIAACKALMWGKAAYAAVFCVCRDMNLVEDNAANFERLLADGGTVIPEGTINTTINRNPWMKFSIFKWKEMGVKDRALKLKDAFKDEMESIKNTEKRLNQSQNC